MGGIWYTGNMPTIVKIVAVVIFIVIFVVVAYSITTKITKQVFDNVFEKETARLPQAQKGSLTPVDIANYVSGGRLNRVDNLHQVSWAGHNFEVSQLRDVNYKSDGKIEWTDNGFLAHDYSMPRSKLLDVNMNQKIKIKVTANMEGKLESDVPKCTTDACFFDHSYPFAEFGVYFVDNKDDGEIRFGIALIGTRDRIALGNARNKFKFDWFSVENTGKEIIFEDSSGRKFALDKNTRTNHTLSELNQGDEWRLRINSHVNGKGYTKLEIKEIQVTPPSGK